MFIEKIIIRNYKRFKETELTMTKENNTSVLIGPNNSGKTSFLEGVSKFLTEHSSLRIFDLPSNQRNELNDAFDKLVSIDGDNIQGDQSKEAEFSESYKRFQNLLPSLKFVISYESDNLPMIKHFLFDLDFLIKKVSFTILFEPREIRRLIEDFNKYMAEKKLLSTDHELDDQLVEHYWPSKLYGFLKTNQNFQKYFEFKCYISNPMSFTTKEVEEDGGNEQEEFPYTDLTRVKMEYVYRLIRVDSIAAGRYLGDVDDQGKSIDVNEQVVERESRISKLLTEYAHRSPNEDENETEIVPFSNLDRSVIKGKYSTEKNLKEFYEDSLNSLIEGFRELGYPGMHSPDITVFPDLEYTQSLKKEASILLNPDSGSENGDLPESYNGLGYRQLLYIYLKIHSYIQKFEEKNSKGEAFFHLLLLEEPEANLHAPVQRVLVRRIEEMLTLNSQAIISTHSNHIIDQMKFEQLHYLATDKDSSRVKYLSDTELTKKSLGENNNRFIQKYFELHSHDIFYADGIIVVEGQSEKTLIPHYIKNDQKFSELHRKYISIMDVGGAHAHKFFPLFETLGKPVLIITDLDSCSEKEELASPVDPSSMSSQTTTNSLLNECFKPVKKKRPTVQDLINITEKDKVKKYENAHIRIAFQFEAYAFEETNVYARTFEDALALTNRDWFKSVKYREDYNVPGRGLLKTFNNIFNDENEKDYAKNLFDAVNKKSVKSDFALDLIYYLTDQKTNVDITKKLELPEYIAEGLTWLTNELGGGE